MMELRKAKEIEYYDSRAQEWLKGKSQRNWSGDFEGFNPLVLSSFRFLYNWLEKNCAGKKLLDYGCGNGIHSIFPAKKGAQVIAIDLSEKSLEIAKERAEREGVADKVSFVKMDCEKLEFPDNFFDIIVDGGTFSSLDLNKAFPELARVLKPDGVLIGIETLGHNPLANLKRQINKLRGNRSAWAVSHIFKMPDIKKAQQYFARSETYFFHFFSCFAFPFLSLSGGKIVLKWLERIDEIFLLLPFLKKYAFKTVFMFSSPVKNA